MDEALNVIYPIGVNAENPLVCFVAHSDVVFPDTKKLPLTVTDGKIYCPGIGDDTATVVLTAKGALLDYEKDAAKRYAVSGLILAYYHQLKELAEEYYDNLSVEVVEKKPE